MSQIQSGRWSELLRRATGQAGIEVIASELGPEISPTWQLESNTAEWDYLKSTRRLLCNVDIATGVGNPAWRLRNPANSSVLAVVDRHTISVNNGAVKVHYMIEHDASDLGTTGFPIVSDTRWVPIGTLIDASISSLVFTTDNSGSMITSGALIGTYHIAHDVQPLTVLETPVVLSPGWSMTMTCSESAKALMGCVEFRERTLPPLER